mmetsp:Transcript_3253/g.4013  ORF Transcript_3253/g.4013 Transcript_3253/m.4013 type:complete len:214 (-) Transcript_3253:86-727(-)
MMLVPVPVLLGPPVPKLGHFQADHTRPPLPPMAVTQQVRADEALALAEGGCPCSFQSPMDRYFDPVAAVNFGPVPAQVYQAMPPTPECAAESQDSACQGYRHSEEDAGDEPYDMVLCERDRQGSITMGSEWTPSDESPVAGNSNSDEGTAPAAVFVDLSCLRPSALRRAPGAVGHVPISMRRRGSNGKNGNARLHRGMPSPAAEPAGRPFVVW